MVNFIAIDLQLHKIFKITRVSLLAHIVVSLPHQIKAKKMTKDSRKEKDIE